MTPGAITAKRRSTSEAAEVHGENATLDFRCALCADVIGVYEPLVVREGSGARITSRAAEPQLDPVWVCYHRKCFESDADAAFRPVDGPPVRANR